MKLVLKASLMLVANVYDLFLPSLFLLPLKIPLEFLAVDVQLSNLTEVSFLVLNIFLLF